MKVSRANLDDPSQSHINVFNSFNVMLCMEMCGDCHDQEEKNFQLVNTFTTL